MRMFKRINLSTIEDEFYGKLNGKIHIKEEGGVIEGKVTYGDYLFSTLKKDLTTITEILTRNKIKQAYVTLYLGEDRITFHLNKDSSDTLVELYETVKSVLPSAKYIYIQNGKVEYSLGELDLVLHSGAKVSNVLANFFADDYTDMGIVINVPGNISVAYEFEWLNSDVIGQTFSNSGRYYEMINFVHATPHPNVETFKFTFKDSTKGIYAELDIDYLTDQPKAVTLKENEWIRSKLNQKYTHLPVF